MITQQKLNNIHKLQPNEVLQIFHECVEYLGLSDMESAELILGKSKRRIYQLMTPKNSLFLCKHKLPFVNLLIK